MDIIETEFEDVVIKRGNMRMYNTVDAVNVIKKCHQLNKKIYAIDALKVWDTYIQPFMEQSVDYTEITDDPKCNVWEMAIEFINSKKDMGFVYEIVYDGYGEEFKKDFYN